MARSVVTAGRLSKIEGVQEMLDKIATIMDRTTAENLKDTFLEAGAVVQQLVIAGAPYDDKHRVRMLKNGTEWPHLRDAVFLTKGRSNVPNVIVGISHRRAPQGIWVEYGTEHSQAEPFFRPAVNSSRPMVASILIDGLNEIIQNSVK